MDKGFPALYGNTVTAMRFSQHCAIRAFQGIYVCKGGGGAMKKPGATWPGFLRC